MKKCLPLLLAVLLLLSACSVKKSAASEKGKSIARQAVQTIDDYMDGVTSYRSASDTLDDLYRRMDYTSDYSYPMTDEEKADRDIQRNILFASHHMISDYFHGDADTFRDVLEYRNALAALADMESR